VVWAAPTRSTARHRARHSVVWLTQASHVGIGTPGWGSKEWIVIAIWSIPMGGVAGRTYRRDTKRV
jgi:hypothetical protein